jgi:hypothetical protein
MTEDEFDEQGRLQEEIEAMTPEDRAEFFRRESLEMMQRIEQPDFEGIA